MKRLWCDDGARNDDENQGSRKDMDDCSLMSNVPLAHKLYGSTGQCHQCQIHPLCPILQYERQLSLDMHHPNSPQIVLSNGRNDAPQRRENHRASDISPTFDPNGGSGIRGSNHAGRGLRTLASHREPFVPGHNGHCQLSILDVDWRNSNESGRLSAISLPKTCNCHSSVGR